MASVCTYSGYDQICGGHSSSNRGSELERNDFNNYGNNITYACTNSNNLGSSPLSTLRQAGDEWTLVPVSALNRNVNQQPKKYEDTPESIGMGKGVYLETSHVDFLLCMALSGQSADAIISRCEQALLSADVNNVTESYMLAAKYGMRHVMDSLIQLIRDNFIAVTQTRQFLELPVEIVEIFLSDTFVNVDDELDVFSTALRWVDYNKQERLCQAGRVLNCVRYEKIRPIDIRDHIEPNIHLFNGPCGPEALVNIYRTHALNYSAVDAGGPLGPRVRGNPEESFPTSPLGPKPAGGAVPGRGSVVSGRGSVVSGTGSPAPSQSGNKATAASAQGKKGGPGSAKGAPTAKPPPGKKPGPQGKTMNNASRDELSPPALGAKVFYSDRSASNSRGPRDSDRHTHWDDWVRDDCVGEGKGGSRGRRRRPVETYGLPDVHISPYDWDRTADRRERNSSRIVRRQGTQYGQDQHQPELQRHGTWSYPDVYSQGNHVTWPSAYQEPPSTQESAIRRSVIVDVTPDSRRHSGKLNGSNTSRSHGSKRRGNRHFRLRGYDAHPGAVEEYYR